MKKTYRLLSFDFGASSGRAVLGTFDGEKLDLQEIHRFQNDPVTVNGTMYWDILRLFFEVKQALIKSKAYGELDGIGVDTWGVDFGLLDADGRLLENPVHYRDARTAGMLEKAFEYLPKSEFYSITGNQFMEINTAFQLLSLRENRPALLDRAETLLLMPDLLNFMLTGKKCTEYSIASTTQLLDAKQRVWSKQVISALELPERLFTEIVPTATKVGALQPDLCEELGLSPAAVIAVAGHDTQCAMASVPTDKEDFLFLSCGTWSLLGTELSAPIINSTAETCNVTNEGGYAGKASFLKNIIGLWLIQETRRQWQKEGENLSFAEMETLARAATPYRSFIDPDAPEFVPAGNIPRRVQEYCRKTGQPVPETKGEILRCIYDSLSLKYRYAVGQIETCTEKQYDALHIVGGGVKDTLLCQLTADAIGKAVVAGPVEATVYGNLVLQLLALGAVKDLKEAREIVRRSDKVNTFIPNVSAQVENAYKTFLEVNGLC
ncbi:MAG: rhamnulokinase family protein [Candidatus Fimenecus sp.]